MCSRKLVTVLWQQCTMHRLQTCRVVQVVTWCFKQITPLACGTRVHLPSPPKRQPWYEHMSSVVPSAASSRRPSDSGARRCGHMSSKQRQCLCGLSASWREQAPNGCWTPTGRTSNVAADVQTCVWLDVRRHLMLSLGVHAGCTSTHVAVHVKSTVLHVPIM